MSKTMKGKDLKLGFFGTPRFAVSVLEELVKGGIEPALIVTASDKPAGRGLALKKSDVKKWAEKQGLDVITPKSLRAEEPVTEILFNSEWDLFIVAAYGYLIPFDVLKLARYGSLNVHPSLLPRFRGPSPIESAILADEKETGVTIMLLDEELDHGPILAQASIAPEPWPIRASILEEILARAGGELLAEVIPRWVLESSYTYDEDEDSDTIKPEPQDHSRATFTKKIEKEDGEIDLANDGYQNYLKFCAYDEWPGTYFFAERNEKKIRVKITNAEFAVGEFRVLRVIPEGKREMNYVDFVRGTS